MGRKTVAWRCITFDMIRSLSSAAFMFPRQPFIERDSKMNKAQKQTHEAHGNRVPSARTDLSAFQALLFRAHYGPLK